jgi:hypothetical protein
MVVLATREFLKSFMWILENFYSHSFSRLFDENTPISTEWLNIQPTEIHQISWPISMRAGGQRNQFPSKSITENFFSTKQKQTLFSSCSKNIKMEKLLFNFIIFYQSLWPLKILFIFLSYFLNAISSPVKTTDFHKMLFRELNGGLGAFGNYGLFIPSLSSLCLVDSVRGCPQIT